MRVLVTGGRGVLGRNLVPRLSAVGHEVSAPTRDELDLFDPVTVAEAVAGADAVVHLATRIPPPERFGEPDAWVENDRLRAQGSRILVDAALASATAVYVQASVAFVYPPGPADEDTPVDDVPATLRSVLEAERQALRFAAAGRRGVVLRLGLLYGEGAWTSTPDDRHGATLEVADAGEALAASLEVPSGVYNVVDDGNPVSNERFVRATGWRPRRGARAQG
jgi:nucleoside-diphosphate-sugar epimerase